MPQYMDFHQDLKLPAEAIAQIAALDRMNEIIRRCVAANVRRLWRRAVQNRRRAPADARAEGEVRSSGQGPEWLRAPPAC